MCMHVQFGDGMLPSPCAVFPQQLRVMFPSYCPGILPQVRDHVNSIEDVQAARTQVALRSSIPPVLILIRGIMCKLTCPSSSPGLS